MQKEKEMDEALLTSGMDLELVVSFCSILALHIR